MTDPMSVAIATAIVGKAVEVAGDQAREAVAAIARKVRDRFRGRPADEAALIAAAEDPGSADRVAALAEALRRAALDDPAFDTELRELWQQVRLDMTAGHDGVVNSFQGQAGKIVQLRDVHGDLTIN
jgi:hypothetical protein